MRCTALKAPRQIPDMVVKLMPYTTVEVYERKCLPSNLAKVRLWIHARSAGNLSLKNRPSLAMRPPREVELAKYAVPKPPKVAGQYQTSRPVALHSIVLARCAMSKVKST